MLAAHIQFGDSGRVADLISLYTSTGVYELPNGSTLTGTDQMMEVLGGASSTSSETDWGLEYMRHHLTTSVVILIDETSARSDTYFVNVNNRGLDHWGRWQDRFDRQTDGRWLFTNRKVVVEGSHPDSWFRLASGLFRPETR